MSDAKMQKTPSELARGGKNYGHIFDHKSWFLARDVAISPFPLGQFGWSFCIFVADFGNLLAAKSFL